MKLTRNELGSIAKYLNRQEELHQDEAHRSEFDVRGNGEYLGIYDTNYKGTCYQLAIESMIKDNPFRYLSVIDFESAENREDFIEEYLNK